MITYLAKQRHDDATYAAAARQLAFRRFLASEVPGSAEDFSLVSGSTEAAGSAFRALIRLFSGIGVVWSSGNRWVVVDYPNHPASVPRRLPVFAVACFYLGVLRAVCTLRGAGLVVQSEDDPAAQEEWLNGRRLGRGQLLLERAYESLLYRAADRLWFSGRSAAGIICERFGLATSNVWCVPNGAPRAVRPTVVLREGTFRFVYAGSMHQTHGVAGLVDAFGQVRDPDARLVLLGPDGEWVPGYLETRGDDRIAYLGCLRTEEAQGVVEQCDAGVVTGEPGGYHSTGFPGKLGVYLAAGIPIVATCGGDTGRLIDERGMGVRCEPERLGGAMDGLTVDRAAWAALRRNAQLIRGEFEWDAIFSRAVASLACEGSANRHGPRARVCTGGDGHGDTRGKRQVVLQARTRDEA